MGKTMRLAWEKDRRSGKYMGEREGGEKQGKLKEVQERDSRWEEKKSGGIVEKNVERVAKQERKEEDLKKGKEKKEDKKRESNPGGRRPRWRMVQDSRRRKIVSDPVVK
ncbi:hypothetical protein WN48_08753 [Eufriesea mexicana]|nr:hypothetical protein WN48_08753 [Eufriesea mexicana]